MAATGTHSARQPAARGLLYADGEVIHAGRRTHHSFQLGRNLARPGPDRLQGHTSVRSDRDCKDKEFCVDRKCQQCRNNGDCARVAHAPAVAAPPFSATADKSECAKGQVCMANQCGLWLDSECPSVTAAPGLCIKACTLTRIALAARPASMVCAWHQKRDRTQTRLLA